MDGDNASVSLNGSRPLWPLEIGDADLLPDDLSHRLKLIFIAAYTTIILLALGGNGLMVNKDRSCGFIVTSSRPSCSTRKVT